MLCVIETHPIQYHAPVWREVQQAHGIPVTAIYGSDFSVAGYRDREFNTTFQWDTDLLSGYTPMFLSRANVGGARNDIAGAERIANCPPKPVIAPESGLPFTRWPRNYTSLMTR